jgi:acetyl esterase
MYDCSPEMNAILEMITEEDGQQIDPTTLAPEQGRSLAEFSNVRWNTELPQMESVADLEFNTNGNRTTRVRIYSPTNFDSGTILHIHGGGWAFCSIETHERASRLLANSCRAKVVSLQYRLAPENPYPAGLEDCIGVWREILKNGASVGLLGPFVVAGDSAGANLALSLILSEMKSGQQFPEAALLFYGVFGNQFTTESYHQHADGPGLTRQKMQRYCSWYTNEKHWNNPLAYPLLADDSQLSQLPPIFMSAAAVDPLRSDSELLYARLQGLGRTDLFRLYDGVVHGFMQMSLVLPQASQAFRDAADAFRILLPSSDPNSFQESDK